MALMERTTDIPINLFRPNAPMQATVTEIVRLNPESESDVKHIVLEYDADFRYLEGQSVGVVTPGVDEQGKPHKLRLYSVASARVGDRADSKTVSLCVKRVLFTKEDGTLHVGPASNYLCDLKVGDTVQLTGPVGRTFLLPENPEANILMFATGTGIAPFRAFLKHMAEGSVRYSGKNALYFGMMTSADILYRTELEGFATNGLLDLHYAISREQKSPSGRSMYVQERVRQMDREATWALLSDPNTYIYICGLKGLEEGLRDAFAEMAPEGVNWEEFQAAMKKDGRFHVEVY